MSTREESTGLYQFQIKYLQTGEKKRPGLRDTPTTPSTSPVTLKCVNYREASAQIWASNTQVCDTYFPYSPLPGGRVLLLNTTGHWALTVRARFLTTTRIDPRNTGKAYDH